MFHVTFVYFTALIPSIYRNVLPTMFEMVSATQYVTTDHKMYSKCIVMFLTES